MQRILTMERLLYLLPNIPQPAWVRCAATTVLMALCFVAQSGLNEQTGFVGFYLLLAGIFAAGISFTRGASVYATTLGAAFTYLLASPAASIRVNVLTLTLFSLAGLLIGVFSEALRTELERAMRAEKSKTVLLMELAHRTKNNLAMLSAMMRLQAKDPDATASQALREMAGRIQFMAEVYDHLTIREERKVVDAREYLKEVCRHLSASISGISPVAIAADADELYIHSEHAVPIAIIINELVTNGLKYGFPEGRAGRIQVTLRASDEVVVSVADNGVGLRGSSRTGVGSRVVSLLVEQLGKTLTQENLDPGYRVTPAHAETCRLAISSALLF
jgi:two-component system, sensor histidine kinase PdtaS